MLEKHIAKRSLEAANIFEKNPREGQDIDDPLVGDYDLKLRPYTYSNKHIVDPRLKPTSDDAIAYSILLYGPPGTGKTGFAEQICNKLKWPLVTVTPSDFMHGGESEVESRAKRIFEVLEDQINSVILFDEIDRMILDRSSKAYTEQGDVFQFMTPSMLTKIRNLREKKRVIFIIATNYKERIDPAVIRKGRIDDHLLMPPPNMEGRKKIFYQLIKAQIKTNIEDTALDACGELKTIIKKTSLKVYSEIKGLFDDAINDLSSTDKQQYVKIIERLHEKVSTESESSSISLMSYKPRLTEEFYSQRPFMEFFVLFYLKLESGGPLETQEKQLACDALSQLIDTDKIDTDKIMESVKNKKDDIKQKFNDLFPEINNFTDTILDKVCAPD